MEVKIDRRKLIMARYGKGWSVKELAAKAGVASITIVNMESGKRFTMPAALTKICTALGLDISDVLNFVEDDLSELA